MDVELLEVELDASGGCSWMACNETILCGRNRQEVKSRLYKPWNMQADMSRGGH
jgi:hypothetical protein